MPLTSLDKGLLQSPYLTSQLIAYIGNKRALLGSLYRLFGSFENVTSFIDPFAGSGSVSRLARAMGFTTGTNDWEEYSSRINRAYLTVSPSELPMMYADKGGLNRVLEFLNQPEEQQKIQGGGYISRHYAPRQTETADYRRERLFYTAENARFIDRVRDRIEAWYLGEPKTDLLQKEKSLLLALLLYEAATHANTSGVFKACHKGFGGHGGDALTRIMAPMYLKQPVLWEGSRDSFVTSMDAVEFAAGHSADLCYLDPPYNQHQYGSNYHMLNTIARWDKPSVSAETNAQGRLKEKAGIRKDWVETRSDFCYTDTAPGALKSLLDNIDARVIVLSYNTEGIIPFEELFDLMSESGRTVLHCDDYVKYRGGKQSIDRKVHNLEIQLVLTRNEQPRSADREHVTRFLLEKKASTLMKGSFAPSRLQSFFTDSEHSCGRNRNSLVLEGQTAVAEDGYKIVEYPDISRLSVSELKRLIATLEQVVCRDRVEESEVLLSLISEPGSSSRRIRKYLKRLLLVTRKFAFRKYREEFSAMILRIQELSLSDEDRNWLNPQLDLLIEISQKRFQG